MKKILTFLDENLEAILLVILLAAISIVMMLQIIMRFVFHNALPWPEELCRICFVYSGFLCYSFCQKKRTAIKIDVLVGMLPNVMQKVINVLGELLMFAFYVFLFVQSIELLQVTAAGGTKTSALLLPLEIEYFALTLGMALAAFRSIEMFIRFLLSRKGGENA